MSVGEAHMSDSLDTRRADDLVYLVAYWGLSLEGARFLQVDGTWKHNGSDGAAKILRPEAERLAAELQAQRQDTIHLWIAERAGERVDELQSECRPGRRRGPRWTTVPVTADPCGSSPGFFARRLTAGGAEVPCRLWTIEDRDEDGELQADVQYFAEVNGEPVDALSPPGWPWKRITEAEYSYMTDIAKWDREFDPSSPRANPDRPATESPKLYI